MNQTPRWWIFPQVWLAKWEKAQGLLNLSLHQRLRWCNSVQRRGRCDLGKVQHNSLHLAARRTGGHTALSTTSTIDSLICRGICDTWGVVRCEILCLLFINRKSYVILKCNWDLLILSTLYLYMERHGLKLLLCLYNYHRDSFVFRGSLLWNKLPRTVRNEPKLSKFKIYAKQWVLQRISRFDD